MLERSTAAEETLGWMYPFKNKLNVSFRGCNELMTFIFLPFTNNLEFQETLCLSIYMS